MVGRRLISGRQALGVEYDMRDDLYAQLVRLSFGFYDRHQTGQLMSRATVDLQAVRFFLGYGLIFFAQHIVTIVAVSVVLFVIDWRLALIAVDGHAADRRDRVPLQPRLAPRAARRAAEARRRRDGRRGVDRRRPRRQVVRAGARPRGALPPRHRHASSPRACARTGSARCTCRCSPSCRSSRRAPCCSRPGGWSCTAALSLGDFFRFNLLLAMLVMPLRMLGMWIGQAQRATASGERIFEILDEPEEIADRPGARAAAARPWRRPLRARHASATRPERAVLDEIDLDDPGRSHRRADRPHGLRQDDARVARAALLRRDRGPRPRRRRRRARRQPTLAAPRDRRDLAGSVPLLGLGAREHRVRPPGRAASRRSRPPRARRRRTSFVERAAERATTR